MTAEKYELYLCGCRLGSDIGPLTLTGGRRPLSSRYVPRTPRIEANTSAKTYEDVKEKFSHESAREPVFLVPPPVLRPL